MTEYLVLDTETTGISAYGQEPLSIAIIDQAGTVLLDTLVRPVQHKTWPGAEKIHGITPAQVLRPDVPTLAELTPRLVELLHGRNLVVYNADYDTEILADVLRLGPPASVHCAMEAFAKHYGDWHEWHQSYTWQSLDTAASYVLHKWKRKLHHALPDCYAALAVWQYLHVPERQQWVREEKERRAEAAEVRQAVERLVEREQKPERERLEALNLEWTRAFWQRVGGLANPTSARKSADAFCRQLTGYPVHTWNKYGKLLKLPRYGEGCRRKLPAHLAIDGQHPAPHHFLRPTWRPGHHPAPGRGRYSVDTLLPVAMWVSQGWSDELELTPLFDLRQLTLGVDYVPYSTSWPPPEGYCSASTLRKEHKLKPKQIAELKPAFLRSSNHKYIPDYLLYPIPTQLPAG